MPAISQKTLVISQKTTEYHAKPQKSPHAKLKMFTVCKLGTARCTWSFTKSGGIVSGSQNPPLGDRALRLAVVRAAHNQTRNEREGEGKAESEAKTKARTRERAKRKRGQKESEEKGDGEAKAKARTRERAKRKRKGGRTQSSPKTPPCENLMRRATNAHPAVADATKLTCSARPRQRSCSRQGWTVCRARASCACRARGPSRE